jgi:hypothetical protein
MEDLRIYRVELTPDEIATLAERKRARMLVHES